MKFEKSVGAVIYKIENNKIFFLISKMGLGHFSLTKGHQEENETDEETALREIMEEASLNVTLDTSFKEKITYSPSKNVIKDVYFFIAKINDNKQVPKDLHDTEVVSFLFLEFDEAKKTLTYSQDQEVLTKASAFINKKEGIK